MECGLSEACVLFVAGMLLHSAQLPWSDRWAAKESGQWQVGWQVLHMLVSMAGASHVSVNGRCFTC